MKREYLGDSYDAVKRLWQDVFADWAPLYAEPRYLPPDLHEEFTRLTRIPILNLQRPVSFSILNDPDTGIRLSTGQKQSEGRKHATILTILTQLRQHTPRCVVTFDQSDYRHLNLSRQEQRQLKIRALSDGGATGFYYVSHAPFLFAFPNQQVCEEASQRLLQAGIPRDRLEILD